jgi:hypothetical protein
MESGSGDPWIPDGWVGYVAAAGELIQWSADYVIGPHSLKLNNVDGLQATGFQTDKFDVEAGKTYRAKFWLKWTGENSGNMKYLMKNGNGTTNMNDLIFSLNRGDFVDWKMVTRDFLCTISGPDARFRFRGAASPTIWLVDQVSVVERTGDSYHASTPTERDASLSDVFMNTRYNVGGNVWFDVLDDGLQGTAWDILTHKLQDTAWDILNQNIRPIAWDILNHINRDIAWDILNHNSRDIAWDILNHNVRDIVWDILNTNTRGIAWDILTHSNQEFSWSVFARVLYFIQQFYAKAICFDYNISEPQIFNKQIVHPVSFDFKSTETIDDTIYLHGEVFDTIAVSTPVTFNFQIKKPVKFTFGVATVLEGEQVEYPPA